MQYAAAEAYARLGGIEVYRVEPYGSPTPAAAAQLSPELKQEFDHLHGRLDALQQQLGQCAGCSKGCKLAEPVTVTHEVQLVARALT